MNARLISLAALGLVALGCGGSSADGGTASADTGSTDMGNVIVDSSPTMETSVPDAANDGAAVDSGVDGGADSGDAAPVCSMLDPGPAITVQGVAANAMAFTSGGTIIPGAYVVTEATDYTGPGGMTGARGTMRRTMVFTATTYETARRDNDGPVSTFAGTWVYGTTGGGMPTWQPTDLCPGTTATTYGAIYQATPTTVKMFVGSGDETVTRLITMTKK